MGAGTGAGTEFTLGAEELALDAFDALTFDCYGTLIDWETGLLATLRPWAERHGVAADDEALLAAHAEAEPRCEAATPTAPYPEILAAALGEMATRFGVEASAAERAAFGASIGDWPAFADSPEALRYLARHFRLVVVSNVDRASFARSREKLDVDFTAVVTAEEVGAYKPDRRMFDAALATLEAIGVSQDRVLHVAQSLYHDHVPAKRLGMKTVWVDRRGGRPGGATPPAEEVRPDLRVTSLGELAALHRRQVKGEA